MKHFKENEFGEDARGKSLYALLHPDLKVKLDRFRELHGAPVLVSPAEGAVARWFGPENTSMHNVERVGRGGKTFAVDVMPLSPSGKSLTKAGLKRAYETAVKAGFTGIGVYPDWRPHPGLHVDVRPGRPEGQPAKWGAVRRKDGTMVYVALEEVL